MKKTYCDKCDRYLQFEPGVKLEVKLKTDDPDEAGFDLKQDLCKSCAAFWEDGISKLIEEPVKHSKGV